MSMDHNDLAPMGVVASPHLENSDDLLLTWPDCVRLEFIASGESGHTRKRLLEKLTRKKIVANHQMPRSIATMGSMLRYRIGDGPWQRRILSFPDAAPPSGQFLNVVTPIGLALLGRKEGEILDVELPDGRCVTVELDEVSFQPEAEARKSLLPLDGDAPFDDGPDAA